MTDHPPEASRVLFWNIWGHRHPSVLQTVLQQHSSTDVLCLTEVTDVAVSEIERNGTTEKFGTEPNEPPTHVNGYAHLCGVFKDTHRGFYNSSRRSDWTCTKRRHTFERVGFGSALFFKNGVTIIATGKELLCDDTENVRPRVVQWIVYQKNLTVYLVAHFHGIWIRENTKGDDPARTLQSSQFLAILQSVLAKHHVDKVVFGGDFNLDINTHALTRLADIQGVAGGPYRNLIAEHKITNTRTSEYRKFGWPGESLYADYVFAGMNVEVLSFAVKKSILASNHAPLIVEFH